jgi:hypothetical protein
LNYWFFRECYDVYKGYNDGTMSFSQAFHYIWQISDPPFALMSICLWGLASFIFWLIMYWNVPIPPVPSLQDKKE